MTKIWRKKIVTFCRLFYFRSWQFIDFLEVIRHTPTFYKLPDTLLMFYNLSDNLPTFYMLSDILSDMMHLQVVSTKFHFLRFPNFRNETWNILSGKPIEKSYTISCILLQSLGSWKIYIFHEFCVDFFYFFGRCAKYDTIYAIAISLKPVTGCS